MRKTLRGPLRHNNRHNKDCIRAVPGCTCLRDYLDEVERTHDGTHSEAHQKDYQGRKRLPTTEDSFISVRGKKGNTYEPTEDS